MYHEKGIDKLNYEIFLNDAKTFLFTLSHKGNLVSKYFSLDPRKYYHRFCSFLGEMTKRMKNVL